MRYILPEVLTERDLIINICYLTLCSGTNKKRAEIRIRWNDWRIDGKHDDSNLIARTSRNEPKNGACQTASVTAANRRSPRVFLGRVRRSPKRPSLILQPIVKENVTLGSGYDLFAESTELSFDKPRASMDVTSSGRRPREMVAAKYSG